MPPNIFSVGQFELIADPIKRAANPLSTHQKDSEEVSHATKNEQKIWKKYMKKICAICLTTFECCRVCDGD
jgi:hypothetical protein